MSDARLRSRVVAPREVVWQGRGGSDGRGVMFDAVSLSTDDRERISALIGERAITADAMRAVLADWLA